MSDLDRLYELLTAKTGIVRRRDARLERLAADRALEGRFEVGMTGQTPISHPINQLKARTWPLQGTFKGVWENAFWWNQAGVDKVAGAVEAWWNSPAHRANLERPEATTWGCGIYHEGNASYFITEFTRDLLMTVIVTTGENFPDGLAAGPFAAERGAPILLVRNSAIPSATAAKLTALKPSEIIVVGGAMSAAVVEALRNYAPTVTWLKGGDRYATAAVLA